MAVPRLYGHVLGATGFLGNRLSMNSTDDKRPFALGRWRAFSDNGESDQVKL